MTAELLGTHGFLSIFHMGRAQVWYSSPANRHLYFKAFKDGSGPGDVDTVVGWQMLVDGFGDTNRETEFQDDLMPLIDLTCAINERLQM